MTLQVLFLIAAVILFIAAAIPNAKQGWMVPIGLALFAASFLPFSWTVS